MIIDRILLKNFKRFRQQEIRFKDGITGILGNNGTGKSSIVEAVFFALYGVQATGISSDYIVSSFAGPKEKCEVRLDFRIGGEDYTVVRTFRKGKTVQHDATFHKGGRLRATGVSQVETEIQRTLGMGPVDFRNTVYAAQKDLLTLLENTPGKRKEWFLKALGIDYLKTESDRILKEKIDGKEREFQLLEGELRGLVDQQDPAVQQELLESMEKYQNDLQDLDHQVRTLMEKKEQVGRELQEFSGRKTEHARLIERHSALSTDIGGLIRQKEQIAAQIDGLPVLEREYSRLEKELGGLGEKKRCLEILRAQRSGFEKLVSEQGFTRKEYADLTDRIGKSRAKIELLTRDAARLAVLCRGVRDQLNIGDEIADKDIEQSILAREAEVLHTIGTLAARLDRLVSERKSLASDWNTIRDAGADGVCPLCHQTLGAHYGEIEEEFTSRLGRIEEEALQVVEAKESMKAEKDRIGTQKTTFHEIHGIRERLKNRDSFEAELRELLVHLQENEGEQRSVAARIQDLGYDEAAFAVAEREVRELESVNAQAVDIGRRIAHGTALKSQAADLTTRIQEKQAELGRIRELIDQADFDPEIGTRLEQARAETDTALRAADAGIAGIRERLRNIRMEIDRYRRQEEAIAGLKERRGSIEDEIDLLRLTRSLIGEYVLYLLQVVRSRIEGEVSRIISEITGGRYEQVLLDEDFNLLIRDIDNDYPIDRFSGGEQDDIAVALRIALSRYLAELHQVHESTLLIFDEIFGSQDEERRTNLLTALRTQESRFPQIILISHIPDIQGEFATTLLVEMGTDLSSRVREVT